MTDEKLKTVSVIAVCGAAFLTAANITAFIIMMDMRPPESKAYKGCMGEMKRIAPQISKLSPAHLTLDEVMSDAEKACGREPYLAAGEAKTGLDMLESAQQTARKMQKDLRGN